VSLGEILSSALSGLGASQAGMRSVSNNIANVNTPGYARQRVSQQPGVTQGRTSGVVVGEPSRVADRYLEETVYARAGDAGRADTVASYLDRLQSLLGANGSTSALPARLDAVASAATAMTAVSGGAQASGAFVGQVSDALGTMRQLSGDLSSLRADADGEVSVTVDRVNALLSHVSDLNDTIAQQTGLGRSPSGAADQRTAALEELSGLIGITAREQSNGRVMIETASGVPLLDQRLRQLSYPAGGAGVDQPGYPAITVHFAEKGGVGAATGQTLDTPATGGKLGGLIDLRDGQLPAFRAKLDTLYDGLARTLNAAANANTAVPAPASLQGKATALAAGDRLGFTGAASFAVTSADGTVMARTRLDFGAMGAGATVADAVAAINAGLGGAATATFADGRLTIAAAGTGNGVAVGQDATAPSQRAGQGFSQYFGLNDLVRSDGGSVAPAGFAAADPHGFAAGGAVDLALRDASGRLLARTTLTPAAGGTFGSLVAGLNAGPMGAYGSFSLDDGGSVRFQPSAGNVGAAISVRSDTTERAGTGLSFSQVAGLTAPPGLTAAEVRRDVAADPARLPLARLQDGGVGTRVLGTTDRRGATGFADATAATVDMGGGPATVSRFASTVLGEAGAAAARAESRASETVARRDDAVGRRDSFSGVNIDEELGQMVILQNSYSAAARMVSTAGQMYDQLLAMVR